MISQFILLLFAVFQPAKPHQTMLCLGDSYTIGESVETEERFPEQTISILNQSGFEFDAPKIIARTGWTSGQLINAVAQSDLNTKYDYVTLLIGVNDLFQGKSIKTYEANFEALINTAIHYTRGNADHVFVLSIPDYGVTPFGERMSKSSTQIGKEIDNFNAVNKIISQKHKVSYIDITEISRRAATDNTLLANDGLHPSGKMYKLWAELLAAKIKK